MKAALRRSLFCLGGFLAFPEILDFLDFLDFLDLLDSLDLLVLQDSPPAASPNASD